MKLTAELEVSHEMKKRLVGEEFQKLLEEIASTEGNQVLANWHPDRPRVLLLSFQGNDMPTALAQTITQILAEADRSHAHVHLQCQKQEPERLVKPRKTHIQRLVLPEKIQCILEESTSLEEDIDILIHRIVKHNNMQLREEFRNVLYAILQLRGDFTWEKIRKVLKRKGQPVLTKNNQIYLANAYRRNIQYPYELEITFLKFLRKVAFETRMTWESTTDESS